MRFSNELAYDIHMDKDKQEELDSYEDLKDLHAAKMAEGDDPTISLDEARKQLGI
ncbi:MAG: hypothetical protein QG656_2735 [Candidatus Hydrogenedentes bacterium]|nr:hypothetical protein [Candidatus Hydrogenedentota bacterium]